MRYIGKFPGYQAIRESPTHLIAFTQKLKLPPRPSSRMQGPLVSCFPEHPWVTQFLEPGITRLRVGLGNDMGPELGTWTIHQLEKALRDMVQLQLLRLNYVWRYQFPGQCGDKPPSQEVINIVGHISVERQHYWMTIMWPFTCGILPAFALQRKKQTAGGGGTCSMYPGAEIRLRPKSVWYEGLFWSTSYLHGVSFCASRTQKCYTEQQRSFRNPRRQAESQQ